MRRYLEAVALRILGTMHLELGNIERFNSWLPRSQAHTLGSCPMMRAGTTPCYPMQQLD